MALPCTYRFAFALPWGWWLCCSSDCLSSTSSPSQPPVSLRACVCACVPYYLQELAKIVKDNFVYARVAKYIGNRTTLDESKLEVCGRERSRAC